MTPRMPKPKVVIGCLCLFVIAVIVWQAVEHRRVRQAARDALLNHARDVTNSLEVVLRSQAHFAAVPRARLEAALRALCRSGELLSLAVANPSGEVVTQAGQSLDGTRIVDLVPGTPLWEADRLTLVELVQFAPPDGEEPRDEAPRVVLVDKMPGPSGKGRHRRRAEGDSPDEEHDGAPPRQEDDPAAAHRRSSSDEVFAEPPPPPSGGHGETSRDRHIDPEARARFVKWLRDPARRGERPRYPPWLSEEQFVQLFESHGLQRFVLVLSTASVDQQVARDLWLRCGLGLAGLVAAVGVGMGWRGVQHSTELQMRLVRAGEMNTHLREMNTAAAGLAHETRNPLNAVRGLTQLIAADMESGAETRQRAQAAIEEVDRINSRLGEFIAYSRPRPPRLDAVALADLVADVARTLEADLEEKHVELVLNVPEARIRADGAQLRQILFNLLLNACQAVGDGGRIEVSSIVQGRELALRVADNGPGVPAEAREDIFRPYFTLSECGTGLGLAVTRQVVLAHQWDIAYAEADEGGAVFAVSGIQLV